MYGQKQLTMLRHHCGLSYFNLLLRYNCKTINRSSCSHSVLQPLLRLNCMQIHGINLCTASFHSAIANPLDEPFDPLALHLLQIHGLHSIFTDNHHLTGTLFYLDSKADPQTETCGNPVRLPMFILEWKHSNYLLGLGENSQIQLVNTLTSTHLQILG